MALTKETVVDKIEVMEMGQVQVRTATRVKEDGKVLSSSFSRHVVEPRYRSGRVIAEDGSVTAAGTWNDTDISGENARVQAVANATWTTEVKSAFEAAIEAND
jgi:hypothetical protein